MPGLKAVIFIALAGTMRPSVFAVFEVDQQLKFGSLLDGKVAWLGTTPYLSTYSNTSSG
jgi:hypothetical protein